MTPELWDHVLEVSVSEPEGLRRLRRETEQLPRTEDERFDVSLLPLVDGLYPARERNRDSR